MGALDTSPPIPAQSSASFIREIAVAAAIGPRVSRERGNPRAASSAVFRRSSFSRSWDSSPQFCEPEPLTKSSEGESRSAPRPRPARDGADDDHDFDEGRSRSGWTQFLQQSWDLLVFLLTEDSAPAYPFVTSTRDAASDHCSQICNNDDYYQMPPSFSALFSAAIPSPRLRLC